MAELDLNDRHAWYKKGASDEELFCMLFGHKFGLRINPDKDSNPTLPDLVHKSGMLCELKTRRTPFFTAPKTYGVSPQYAVTINRNDMVRYWKSYRDMPIYFWVHWAQLSWKQVKVDPMIGVWGIRVSELGKLCSDDNLHTYQGRVNDDQGNAKDSFVIDLGDLKELWKAM